MKYSNNYLEIIVHHPEYSLYEYPARYCMLRIPFDSISFYDGGSYIKIFLSEHQIEKLLKIGYDTSYYIVFHRPCDKDYSQVKGILLDVFKLALYRSINNVIP